MPAEISFQKNTHHNRTKNVKHKAVKESERIDFKTSHVTLGFRSQKTNFSGKSFHSREGTDSPSKSPSIYKKHIEMIKEYRESSGNKRIR